MLIEQTYSPEDDQAHFEAILPMLEVRGSDGKMMKTCFLIGHRDAPFMIREKLEKAIAAAIAE